MKILIIYLLKILDTLPIKLLLNELYITIKDTLSATKQREFNPTTHDLHFGTTSTLLFKSRATEMIAYS